MSLSLFSTVPPLFDEIFPKSKECLIPLLNCVSPGILQHIPVKEETFVNRVTSTVLNKMIWFLFADFYHFFEND